MRAFVEITVGCLTIKSFNIDNGDRDSIISEVQNYINSDEVVELANSLRETPSRKEFFTAWIYLFTEDGPRPDITNVSRTAPIYK